jgi:predicted enzyme related to lactoylglutathione lyase
LFFKTEDPDALKAWYRKHLGFETDDWGCTFCWKDNDGNLASTQWSPFKESSNYFAPSEKPFMFNYRVADLKSLLAKLTEEGVEVVGDMEEYDYGKFGWILDPDGNKIELWEPVDQAFT